MSTVFNKIGGVFRGGTAGYDVDLAKAQCQSFCERAKLSNTNTAKTGSAYCTRDFDITKEDGTTELKNCHESGSSIYSPCAGVENLCA